MKTKTLITLVTVALVLTGIAIITLAFFYRDNLKEMAGMYSFVLYVLIAIATLAFLALFVDFLATRGIFFSYVPEGAIIAGLEGRRPAWYAGSLPNGYIVEKKTGKVYGPENKDDEDNYKNAKQKYTIPVIGAVWVGIWPFEKVYTRHFTWKKFDQGTTSFVEKDDPKCKVLVWRYPYGISVKAITQDNVPLTLNFVTTLETVDAAQSLFGTFNWLTEVTASILNVVRNEIGDHTYQAILETKQASTKKDSESKEASTPTTTLALPGSSTDSATTDKTADSTSAKTYSEKELIESVQKIIPAHLFGQKIIAHRMLTPQIGQAENPVQAAAIKAVETAAKIKDEENNSLKEAAKIPGIEAQKKMRIIAAEGEREAKKVIADGDAHAKRVNFKAEREGLGDGETPVSTAAMVDLTKVKAVAEAMSKWTMHTVLGGENSPVPLLNITRDVDGKGKADKKEENKGGEK